MKVLVIGSGGREHAIVWKLSQPDFHHQIRASPGNPGIQTCAECFAARDYLSLAQALEVDLTVVGPEAPLVSGIVDQFQANGMPIVGPTAVCSQLEGSKLYSKQFMQAHDIPTARFATAFHFGEARAALESFTYPIVLKTDGLAAGKGVIIAEDKAQALEALQKLPLPLVIEEFLKGEEVSFIVLSDGKTAIPFEPSQDHKAAYDGDRGPNTGGMGAYSDSAILTSEQRSKVMNTIIEPVIAETGFTGFLYAGLMMTGDGPKVLEFNVRMGDPETQPLMMRLKTDFAEALYASATGTLRDSHFQWDPRPATCVVLASNGYPGTYKTGPVIEGLETINQGVVFHAGTRQLADGTLVTAGGRVLGVTSLGDTLAASIDNAYASVAKIHFDGMHYRKDIGAKGLRRYNGEGRARSSDG